MNPERWQQASRILEIALERHPELRAAYLDEMCSNDPDLRQEVESLLAASAQAGSLLDSPAMAMAAPLFFHDSVKTVLGQSIGRYKILTALGTGGMGEVYLAYDTRLGRKIALKLLSTHFTTDKDRLLRFEQEAHAASTLSHPNICMIHEVGETEDARHFIAMEYIDGVTLRQHMTEARMKLSEVLDVAVQVASGLAASHAVGVVHRDIKPENIMLRHDGYVKVLDFGLAKLTEQPASDVTTPAGVRVSTDIGVVMGTSGYMSPEQTRGLPVDARTDIWSMGVVLYEMITGGAPFEGATKSDVIASVLGREPSLLISRLPEVPAELQRIVSKALRKEREERYEVVKDMLLDLKSLKQELEFEARLQRPAQPEASSDEIGNAEVIVEAAHNVGTQTKEMQTARSTLSTNAEESTLQPRNSLHGVALIGLSLAILVVISSAVYLLAIRGEAIDSIAVLPFVNVNGNPDMEYLSDGITDSLINSLSQVPRLRMIARSSVFRYKGKEVDPQTVGRELSVRAILLGRVAQHGDNLSISAELVDARDNSRIWGEQYSRRLSDILQVQEEISREISDKLRLKLTGEEQKLVAKRYTENVQAYQLYLKGRFYSNKRNEESLKRGVDYFQQAIEKDPNYALAYSGLADSYSGIAAVFISAMPPREAMLKMKLAAQKAVELDDTLAEAHTSLGELKFRGDRDWSGAEREFKRALALNPNYTRAHDEYTQYLVAMGRFEESFAEAKRAQALDPVSPRTYAELGFAYYFAGRYDQAIEEYQRALELDPNFLNAHWLLGFAYANKSMFEQARAESLKAVELSGHGPGALGGLGYVYATLGRRDEAQQVIVELKELAERRYVSPYSLAAIYGRLGDKDAAFEWLEKAYSDGAYGILFLKFAPEWDGLRSEPRFQDVMRRVGLTQ